MRVHHDAFDYLLLSDVHLGSDLVQHIRPWAIEQWLDRKPDVDTPLIELLRHYRETPRTRPLKLVAAGDFLDLVGVAIGAEDAELRTPLNREERAHGLGSAADHVVHKLEAIAARHEGVFRELARFIEAGNHLVVVRGNHDIELHWRAARRAFVRAVARHSPRRLRGEVAARIEICPWFFSVPGLLHVEHGHEFDWTCSYGDPLVPVCARDSRRIRATAFSVLLRQVARPTPGISSSNYGYVGMGAYLGLLRQLGVRGTLDIGVRYTRASLSLLREGLPGHTSRRARRAHHALERFCRQSGLAAELGMALKALYTRPAADRPTATLRLLYLDRICAGLAAGCFATAAVTLSGVAGAACGASAACLGAYAAIGNGANQAPHDSLGQGARRIAELFEARWIVMGHTHKPVSQRMRGGATYINLGSWGQDDPPDERIPDHAPTQSFLLIEHGMHGYDARLLRWVDGEGPLKMDAEAMPALLEPDPYDAAAGGGLPLWTRLRSKLRRLRKPIDAPVPYALPA